MKIIKSFILTILIMSFIPIISNASVPYSNIFKQGTYSVNAEKGDFVPAQYKIEMISKDSIAYVFVIGSDCVVRYSKRFDSANQKTSPATTSTGIFLEGDSIIIFGDGEFFIDKIIN